MWCVQAVFCFCRLRACAGVKSLHFGQLVGSGGGGGVNRYLMARVVWSRRTHAAAAVGLSDKSLNIKTALCCTNYSFRSVVGQ
jgi:hypothetical protein